MPPWVCSGLPDWPCTGVLDWAMPLCEWHSSKAQPSVVVPGSASGPSISEGTIWEKRFLHLLTTAVELTSCRHPTSPQWRFYDGANGGLAPSVQSQAPPVSNPTPPPWTPPSLGYHKILGLSPSSLTSLKPPLFLHNEHQLFRKRLKTHYMQQSMLRHWGSMSTVWSLLLLSTTTTLSVTLRRSVPSLDVHISDLQRWVCYLYRERIPRQLALEHSRSHPRWLGTASRSIFVIPVTAFKHLDGSLTLICSTCHLFRYFVPMNIYWLISILWSAVHVSFMFRWPI